MSLGPVLVTAASVAACAPALQRLRDAGCGLRVLSTPQPFDEAWLVEQVGDVAGLIVAMEPVGARVFAAAPQLKVIARPGVGFDTIDMAAAARHGVAVSIAAGCNDQSVADFTMGLLLAAARGLLPAAASVQAQGWARSAGTEVWGKTLALVGLGRIGQGVARRARGFDLRVLAVTRQQDAATTDFAVRHGVELVGLEDALGQV